MERRSMAKQKTKILLDADVIIHFIKGGQILVLPTIFPDYELSLLDKVFTELKANPSKSQVVDNLINFGTIKLVAFPSTHKNIVTEYSNLKKKGIGEGESACLAYLRFNPDILGSSNIRDIKAYCVEHGIVYFTTMDFLCEAYEKEVLSEEECNNFVKTVLAKGSKLPCKTFYEYDCDTRSVINIDKIGK
jgi:hypothetical protein